MIRKKFKFIKTRITSLSEFSDSLLDSSEVMIALPDVETSIVSITFESSTTGSISAFDDLLDLAFPLGLARSVCRDLYCSNSVGLKVYRMRSQTN